MPALAELSGLGNPWMDWAWAAALFAAVLGVIRGMRLFLLLALALDHLAVAITTLIVGVGIGGLAIKRGFRDAGIQFV